MNNPRFILTEDYGLVLETPIPLALPQLEAVKKFAIQEYTRRLSGLTGDRKERLIKVISMIKSNNFMERAIPAYDFDKETKLYG